jgi:hypothetical protein
MDHLLVQGYQVRRYYGIAAGSFCTQSAVSNRFVHFSRRKKTHGLTTDIGKKKYEQHQDAG